MSAQSRARRIIWCAGREELHDAADLEDAVPQPLDFDYPAYRALEAHYATRPWRDKLITELRDIRESWRRARQH